MIGFVMSQIRGVLSVSLYTANTIFWVMLLFAVALVKAAVPVQGFRRLCSRWLNGIACNWISVNNWNTRVINHVKWDVNDLENLRLDQWYLVLANHQSWVDILVLQKIFNRKIPFIKFFIKKELIWVPFLGLAWWALDFPFMKRYSGAYVKKHPEKRGKDLEITKKACGKFTTIPVSVMNFVEGTRFKTEKHQAQQSPYKNLLKPKAGGTAFVLSALEDRLSKILNVTIVYPHGRKSFWSFLCGRIKEIKVRVEALPVTKNLMGDYFHDPEFRNRFQDWINRLWQDKDRYFESLIGIREEMVPVIESTPAFEETTRIPV
jgi:1-acyl-sn-glycerol-3-phosphate acyltransferase